MQNFIKNFCFVFFLVFLISISKIYALTEEETRLAKEIEYLETLAKQESEFALGIEQEKYTEDEKFSQESALKKISLDIKGMDIVDVLKLLSNEGDLNIVTGKNVTGRVSMFLKDVDVWDAFEIIIAANDLAYEKKGNIIKVMHSRDYELSHGEKFDDKRILKTYKLKFTSAKDLSNALNQIKSALGRIVVDEASNTLILLDVPEILTDMDEIIRKTDQPTEPLEYRIFELNYADAEKIKEQLQEVVTKNVGIIKTDKRTNKLVVLDYPSKVSKISKMIKAFDEKTRQVLIEAKIVQVTLSDKYKMGIDWKYVASKQLNITAFNISRVLDTTGSQIIGGGAISPTSTNDFRIIMDMLKTFGDTKTLSTPRITATDGQEAKILVGSKEVYVQSTVVQGQSTTTTSDTVQFVDVGVKLYVTPTINRDGFITMKIRPEVSSAPRAYTTGGRNIPIVETSEAETSVIAKDGVTIVMGGLMKNERIKNVYKIPLVGDIPLLGGIFRRTEDTDTKTELVIFLTPHIISGAEKFLEKESQEIENAASGGN